MPDKDRKFWPYKPKASIICAVIILVILLLFLKLTIGWPSEKSENTLLIGVLILSLLPIVLALVDIVIEKGIPIEVHGIKLDFSATRELGISSFRVPVNIARPGQPITDSDTAEILKELKQAARNQVTIIDLEEGSAWWETRLFILLAGAQRLGKPEIIVFIGTDGGKKRQFLGWAASNDLLEVLLETDKLYPRCLAIARAAANQWKLVEPKYPTEPPTPLVPSPYDWMNGLASTSHSWMAFDYEGMPNELFAEQLLANEIGTHIEMAPGGIRKISMEKLNQLWHSVLHKEFIDQGLALDKQKEVFFENDSPFIAITEKNTYVGLASRWAVFNEIMRNIMGRS